MIARCELGYCKASSVGLLASRHGVEFEPGVKLQSERQTEMRLPWRTIIIVAMMLAAFVWIAVR
jgi:hypothetical protein